jgi:hypothetical protein
VSVRQPTEETFLKDVKNHKMTVLMDNGVYRHLRFSSGSFNQQFDIVTYPWHLVYSGDMGCYVFSRLEDMFEFFRTGRHDNSLGINCSYWGEKLQAVSRDGYTSSHREYSENLLKEQVEDIVKAWVKEYDGPKREADLEEMAEAKAAFEKALREAVEEEIYYYIEGESEETGHRTLRDFCFEYEGEKYEFSDTWEWNCQDYTYQFVWCCYALAWSIKQYDAMNVEVAAR